MIPKIFLEKTYLSQKLSVSQIANIQKCSENKITYWLQKHNIPKRTIAEAIYIRSNPKGDPFICTKPNTAKEWFMYGVGIGLFWGEGNKVNKNSVRLGNSDPELVKYFLTFLRRLYKIDESKLRFGLQLFSDIPKNKALRYWSKQLGVPKSQFQKVIVSRSMNKGTYRKKAAYGVLTIYFSNTKLRDIIISAITELRE